MIIEACITAIYVLGSDAVRKGVNMLWLGKGSKKKKKNSLEFSIRGGGFLPILGPFPYFFFYF